MARRYSSRKRRYSSRKRNRKLSKANIYLNTSARSQATQIAAVNRKVNNLSKRLKMEYHIITTANLSKTFTSSLLSETYFSFWMPAPARQSALDTGFTGDLCHALSLTLHGYAEYFNNSNTGYHDTESAGCVLRIIAIQCKTADRSLQSPPTPSDLLVSVGGSGDNYTALAFSPFRNGITNEFRILLDYRCTLTTNRNQKLLKVNVPFGKYRDLRFDNQVNALNNMVAFVVIAGGLHYDSNYVETLQFTGMTKLVFRDN